MSQAREVRIHAYGGPEAMVVEETSLPDPAPSQVLVRQHAVGINFIDIYHRKGVFPIPHLPGSIGVEAAGTVEAVGHDVHTLAIGDRVAYAGPPVGSYASGRVLPAGSLVRLPDEITFKQAAAIMLKGMTAHMLVKRVRPLDGASTVLVHAAAGGLGLLLCQWAKALGAWVIGTVGSPAKGEIARRFGCDEVILYKQQDFVAATMDLTEGRGVDVVYEGIGGDVLQRSLDCLRPFGLAVNLGQTGSALGTVELARLGPQRSLSIAVPGVFAHLRTLDDLQGSADELFAMVTSGAIRVNVGLEPPLEQVGEAHRRLEAAQTTGSLILTA